MSTILNTLNKTTAVKQIPLFSKLNWFDIRHIVSKSQLIEFKKGEKIYQKGQEPEAFYCLLSGRLRAFSGDAKEEEGDIEHIYRGMYFGVTSLLTEERHLLSVQAINDSLVLKIAKEDFEKILKQIPALGAEISSTLSRLIRRMERNAQESFKSTVISVYGPRKNVGSSTYAINLALHLKRETLKSVIYVGLQSAHDAQSEAQNCKKGAVPLWKEPGVPLGASTEPGQIFEKIAKDSQLTDAINVVFDANGPSLSKRISEFVGLLSSTYRFVVLDLPNQMDNIVFETLTQSDIIHLVCSDDMDSLQTTGQIIKRLKAAYQTMFLKEKIKVFINEACTEKSHSYESLNRCIGYDVYARLPKISQNEHTGVLSLGPLDIPQIDADSPFYKEMKKIARETGGVLVALVLGSGAAFGLSHIGVLRVFEREHIPFDLIVGSSIGALIGGMWATGKSADEIERAAREFSTKTGCFKLLDIVLSKAGLIAGKSIKRWLKGKIGEKTFYDVKVPFKVTAYDLTRREELVIDEGRLIDAIEKSVAIPGIIKPIINKEQMIIDGGILNPLPTNVAAALGVKKIIAVNVFQSPEEVVTGYEAYQKHLQEERAVPFLKAPGHYILFRLKQFFSQLFSPNISNIIIKSFQASEYLLAEQNFQQADILIHPNLAGIDWFELYRVDELIERGEKAAQAQIGQIKALLAE